jgi:hypothetical protein
MKQTYVGGGTSISACISAGVISQFAMFGVFLMQITSNNTGEADRGLSWQGKLSLITLVVGPSEANKYFYLALPKGFAGSA